MSVPRITFLSHFLWCLAIAAAGFFAWQAGIPQLVLANDVARWFGGAIGALFVFTAFWLGVQAWYVDNFYLDSYRRRVWTPVSADFGKDVQILAPSIGMLGTVVGLSRAFKNVGTADMLSSAATAFYSTGCGIVALILVVILTVSLEAGIKRTRQ